MKKVLLLLVLGVSLMSCNDIRYFKDAGERAALDSVNKVIEEENLRLERMRDVRTIRENSIDYDEPFTIDFYRKKLFAEEGDLKGFLSVQVGDWDDGNFLYFPTEESRESFVNFLKYVVEKKNEWHSVAVKNKVKKVTKVILADTTKYWMATYKRGFKFTEQITLTGRYSFVQVCERRDCASSYINIDFNETDGFSSEVTLLSMFFLNFSAESLNEIINAFSTETINSFIEKEKKEEELFE